MIEKVDILAVRAHPDDESSATGGLLAKYAAEGRKTGVVICTGGEEGEIHDPDLVYEEAFPRLREIREAELRAACEVLRVAHLRLLGYRDSGMDGTESNAHPEAFCNADLEEAGARLAAIIRELRPSVIVTDNEHGGYGHPDHIMSHRATLRGFELAADPAVGIPGDPWRPHRLYVMASVPRAWMQIYELMEEEGLDTSGLRQRMLNPRSPQFPPSPIHLTLDVSDHADTRTEALLRHKTQMKPDSHWMILPPHLRRIAFASVNLWRIYPEPADGERDEDLFPDVVHS
jgi:N-acetyl-1-D-myo-inositol-2-amino-2-deoxy-alpha-D-glucopyranoside deacetylase